MEIDAKDLSIAKIVLNVIGTILQCSDNFGEMIAAEQVANMRGDNAIDQGNHRLGAIEGQWA